MVGSNQGNTRQVQPVYPNLINRQTLTQNQGVDQGMSRICDIGLCKKITDMYCDIGLHE